MSEIKIEYKGEEIEFYEYDESWRWGGKSYPVPSKAKAAIDRSQKVDFERAEAYLRDWNGVAERVTVTSVADSGHFWIVGVDGKRSKEESYRILEITPENDAILARIAQLGVEIDDLRDKVRDCNGELTKFQPAKAAA